MGAGGLNVAPAGWIVTMKRGLRPKPDHRDFVAVDHVTLMHPDLEPPGR